MPVIMSMILEVKVRYFFDFKKFEFVSFRGWRCGFSADGVADILFSFAASTMLGLFSIIFFACVASRQANIVIGSNDDLRNDVRLPVHGTKNWQLLPQRGTTFSPRHSHATTVYKCPDNPSSKCLWLTGGYSELHRSFDLRMENENCDVWYSKDGREWNQVGLDGEFIQGVGNWDAKPGGFAAPWYARYGHSLNALDEDGDGIADVMVLAGGNSPMPSNDVWLSTDGIRWYFDGNAAWSKRAYHSTAVFQ